MDFSILYRTIGEIFPERFAANVEGQLFYAGIEQDVRKWLGSFSLLVFLFSLAGFFAYNIIDPASPLKATIVFAVLLLVLSLLSYINLFFMINSRTHIMEKNLPDFLMLVVSNLRAGMTPYSAFLQAARPEFGPLYIEVLNTAGRIGGKRSLEEAFSHLSHRFDSEIFRKSIELFIKGTKSGGQLAKLLSANAEQIRKIQDLREELVASTRTYMIFLAFIVVIVMPFLMGVSFNFLNTFIAIQSQVGAPGGSSALGGSFTIFSGQLSIKPSEMFNIAILSLVITNFLASLFMGVIGSGRVFYGLKYFPLMIVASLAFFFVSQHVISNVVKV